MDENKDIDLVSMTIIANSGDARSFAFQALASARKGEFDKAEELMKKSDQASNLAHQAQTDLLIKEARGEKQEVNVLLVHSQDHLMTSMLAIELIKEIFNDDIPQNSAISETQHSVSEDKKKTNILFIPPAWNNEHKIINYLESRCISRDLINQEIKANRIKGVSIKGHLNVAFLCYDLTDHTLIKGAIIRGVEGSFKGNLIDSDGDYGYCIGPNQSSVKSIYIFEAPIDLLSYLTMYQQDPNIV